MTPRRWVVRAVDAAVVAGGLGAALWSVTQIFAYHMGVRALVAGILVPLVTLWLTRRLPGILRGLVTLAALMAVAGPLLLPATCLGGVVPTPSTLVALVERLIGSWKDVLTVAGQVSADSGSAVMVYALASLAAAASFACATSRRGWWGVPAIQVAAHVVATLWSDGGLSVWAGAAWAAALLLWGAWRAQRRDVVHQDVARVVVDTPTRTGARGTVALLAAGALVVGIAGVMAMPDATRASLRAAVPPPMDVRHVTSPLASFHLFAREMEDKTLFTIDHVPPSGRIRLAALDAYDGRAFGFDPASSRFLRAAPHATGAGVPRYRVRIEDYRGVWRPGAGEASSMHVDSEQPLFVGGSAQTLMSPRETTSGETYAVAMQDTVVVAKEPQSLVPSSMPKTERVPDVVADKAAELTAGVTDPWGRLDQLARRLRTDGLFAATSDAQARGGHSAARLAALLAAPRMVGDDEQFSVAMTLMARALGIPARVAMGFIPTPGENVAVRGADVRVWVEVPLASDRWAAFDPVPPRDRVAPATQASPSPQPDAKQGPQPEPLREPLTDRRDAAFEESASPPRPGAPTPWLLFAGIALGLGLLTAPFWALALARQWRRRRRRHAPPSRAVVGAWEHVRDTAVDFGGLPPESPTRSEEARSLAQLYPQASLVALARDVDALTFGPGTPTPADVEAVWARADAASAAIVSSHRGTSRLRAQCSLRSWRGQVSWGRAR